MVPQMNRRVPPATPERALAARILAPLERFLHVEASSGVVLLAAAVAALLWANSPWNDVYESFWHAPFTIGLGPWLIEQPLHFWINDGLMTIFFLVVGLEIRREMHDGALSSLRFATLPVAAALGGIVVPALLYLSMVPDPFLRRGWAIPTATDIAFAVGILAILGSRVPSALRALLLTLAIVDDIAAILVIALFYSTGIAWAGLSLVALGVIGVLLFQRLGINTALPYILPGACVWFGLLQAGVHPTLAGVLLGLLTPAIPRRGEEDAVDDAKRALDESLELRRRRRNPRELIRPLRQLALAQHEMVAPVVRVEALLHPWVAYGVMPLFAFANAGISLKGLSLLDPVSASLATGIAGALLIGKPAGITLAAWIAVKFGLAALPSRVNWRGVLLIGLLGGIGFTMSIFIANLAFANTLLASAKFGVLVASATAAVAGLLFGRLTLQTRTPQVHEGEQTANTPDVPSRAAK
jgi:NhaA family Na+:H+ antiporter